MQLKFKNQRRREDAAFTVVSIFQGWPKQDAFTYLRDKSQKVPRKGMESLSADQGSIDEGYANAPLRLRTRRTIARRFWRPCAAHALCRRSEYGQDASLLRPPPTLARCSPNHSSNCSARL